MAMRKNLQPKNGFGFIIACLNGGFKMDNCLFCKIIAGEIPSKKYMKTICAMRFMT